MTSKPSRMLFLTLTSDLTRASPKHLYKKSQNLFYWLGRKGSDYPEFREQNLSTFSLNHFLQAIAIHSRVQTAQFLLS